MSIEPGQDTHPGPQQSPQPPPPPQDIARNARRALWFGLAALVMMFIPVVSIFAVVPAVAALVMGVRARRAARRAAVKAPGAMAGIVLGAIGTALFAVGLVAQLYLLQETNRYSDCRDAANTITAERQCKERFARDIEDKFGLPKDTINPDRLPL